MNIALDKEVVQRLRRIETRLGRYFDHVGFDCGMRRPEWDGGRVVLPSLDASLRDILRCVPKSKQSDEVDIVYNDVVVANIMLTFEE